MLKAVLNIFEGFHAARGHKPSGSCIQMPCTSMLHADTCMTDQHESSACIDAIQRTIYVCAVRSWKKEMEPGSRRESKETKDVMTITWLRLPAVEYALSAASWTHTMISVLAIDNLPSNCDIGAADEGSVPRHQIDRPIMECKRGYLQQPVWLYTRCPQAERQSTGDEITNNMTVPVRLRLECLDSEG